jgi:hypothetical protein
MTLRLAKMNLAVRGIDAGTYLATLGTLLFVSVGFTQTHLGEVDFTPFGNALNPHAEPRGPMPCCGEHPSRP